MLNIVQLFHLIRGRVFLVCSKKTDGDNFENLYGIGVNFSEEGCLDALVGIPEVEVENLEDDSRVD